MSVRPRLLIVILIYVTLDLSLPSMPGAFVFEPDDTVETVRIVYSRDAMDAVHPPTRASELLWAWADVALLSSPRAREAARPALHLARRLVPAASFPPTSPPEAAH